MENTVTIDNARVSYSCGCVALPKIKTKYISKIEKCSVKITVTYSCSKHLHGLAKKLTIGTYSDEVQRCPHKECNCNEAVLKMPLRDFAAYLEPPSPKCKQQRQQAITQKPIHRQPQYRYIQDLIPTIDHRRTLNTEELLTILYSPC